MERLPAMWGTGPAVENTVEGLARMNRRVQGHGLSLDDSEMRALAVRHQAVLRGTGRVEFGDGILPKLVFAFCDSPYIPPGGFADTLDALMECFYHFKNETMEQVGDDELVAYMKSHFDGDCHGSVEYLSGTLLEQLARRLRCGGAGKASDDDEAVADDEA